MQKIKLHDQEITYKLRKSRRAKRMRIAVYGDASVVVTLPCGAYDHAAEKFLQVKASWLLDKISYFKSRGIVNILKNGQREFRKNKEAALRLAEARVDYFNAIYKYKFNKIAIKRQKTRWGSCSRQGNLNFNFKILFLPPPIADYIIVHELCHLKEFNHSKKFWALVRETVPDYPDLKKALRQAR